MSKLFIGQTPYDIKSYKLLNESEIELNIEDNRLKEKAKQWLKITLENQKEPKNYCSDVIIDNVIYFNAYPVVIDARKNFKMILNFDKQDISKGKIFLRTTFVKNELFTVIDFDGNERFMKFKDFRRLVMEYFKQIKAINEAIINKNKEDERNKK